MNTDRTDEIAGEAYQIISDLAGRAGYEDQPETLKALDYFSRGYRNGAPSPLPFSLPGRALWDGLSSSPEPQSVSGLTGFDPSRGDAAMSLLSMAELFRSWVRINTKRLGRKGVVADKYASLDSLPHKPSHATLNAWADACDQGAKAIRLALPRVSDGSRAAAETEGLGLKADSAVGRQSETPESLTPTETGKGREAERDAFEAWCLSRYITALGHNPEGTWGDEAGVNYEAPFVQAFWEAWQARASHPAAPSEVERLRGEVRRLREINNTIRSDRYQANRRVESEQANGRWLTDELRKAEAELAVLRKRIGELTGALEPFAEPAHYSETEMPGWVCLDVAKADLLRARTVLSPEGEGASERASSGPGSRPDGPSPSRGRPWQPWERNYSGNRVGVRQDGDWTILHVLSGGAETTTSIRDHEAWDLAMRLSPALAKRWEEAHAENRRMRDALHELSPVCAAGNADELRETAEEIDCGDSCRHHFYDASCNAHECSAEGTDEGCRWHRAECLRNLAAALETQAASGIETPDQSATGREEEGR